VAGTGVPLCIVIGVVEVAHPEAMRARMIEIRLDFIRLSYQ
jgi:hypothetical protein